MAFKEDLKKHLPRMITDPESPYDIMGTVLDLCSPLTLSSIKSDLTPALNQAIDEYHAEIRDTIRAQALELPEDDPLRLAIEITP